MCATQCAAANIIWSRADAGESGSTIAVLPVLLLLLLLVMAAADLLAVVVDLPRALGTEGAAAAAVGADPAVAAAAAALSGPALDPSACRESNTKQAYTPVFLAGAAVSKRN